MDSATTHSMTVSNKDDYLARKRQEAKERKRLNDIKKLEDKIEVLEELVSALEEKLADPILATNSVEIAKVHGEYVRAKEEVEELISNWEILVG